MIHLTSRFLKLRDVAMFTQQKNTVVSPVFDSLIQLRSHTVQLFTGLTAAFCNQTLWV